MTAGGKRPDPKRDRLGRYLLPDPTGGPERPYSRTTTVTKTLPDQTALTRWKQRQTLLGAARKRQLLDVIDGAGREELDGRVEAAMDAAGSSEAADAGTRLHEITEMVDRFGEAYDVPLDAVADVAAYVDATRGAGIAFPPEYIERICVNPAADCAGMFDRVVVMPGGQHRVFDLKTGKDLSYGWLEIASQLAVYANAPFLFDQETGRYEAMPEVDLEVGIVAHLPVGKGACTLYEVDLVAGWQLVELAVEVRRARALRGLAKSVTSAEIMRQPLLDSIASSTTEGMLGDLWREYRHAWRPEHTEAARTKKSELEQAAA